MNTYQIIRKEFLLKNGFLDIPTVRLAYDKCMQDSMKKEHIVISLKKQGYKND